MSQEKPDESNAVSGGQDAAPVSTPTPPASSTENPPDPLTGNPALQAHITSTPVQAAAGVVVMLVVLLIGIIANKGLNLSQGGLEVIAQVVRETAGEGAENKGQLTVRGRVLEDGNPVSGCSVWAIVSDDLGNRQAPDGKQTDLLGNFAFEKLPASLSSDVAQTPATSAHIFAKHPGAWYSRTKTGDAILEFQKGRGFHLTNTDSQTCLFLGIGLVACILFGLFLPVTTPSWAKFKYWLSVFLALAFVFFSVVYIGSILAKFTTTARSGDISSLGFATIFEGTYVKDQQQEWILSLTAPSKPTTVTPVKVGGTPPPAAGEKPVVINGETVQRSGETVQGLGAPLWVLFLGVFGAAMFTINMIANEIKNPPDFNAIASPDLHNRIQVIVQQQIFCFFAPVVGIFVYQFLVVAGAASQPVTVGVTALGAGATLSFLLARAGKDATDTIDEGAKSQPNKRGGAGSGGVGS